MSVITEQAVIRHRPEAVRQAHDTGAAAPVVVAHGDGIGNEIMDAVLDILAAAGACLDVKPVVMGERVYRQGLASGIDAQTWEELRRRGVLLKGPITTPQGRGWKSLNVTLRKALGLYANVRPCVSYSPFVARGPLGMDVVMIRENEEDVYAGIEHRQTDEVVQCLKLASRPGCERIVRYAFEFARANGRRKVSCFTKDNIMKLTDGLFHRVFDETAALYPDIVAEHLIVDIGAARLATRPREFDVIVLPNLYGDILSDVAAEMTGSVGLVGTANIGEHGAMFEAIHGSAPDLAGTDAANPSGLLLAAVMMLHHLGQHETAGRIHNAWLATIEDGLHTADMASIVTRRSVGTRAFAAEVRARLGALPGELAVKPLALPRPAAVTRRTPRAAVCKELVGVDVFVHFTGGDAELLSARLKLAGCSGLVLEMITNRGIRVWPDGLPETFCVDHWRCRFTAARSTARVEHAQIAALLGNLARAGIDFVKTEHLYTFDGQPGYSAGHGQ